MAGVIAERIRAAPDERADPQDEMEKSSRLRPSLNLRTWGEQLADGAERGDEPRNDGVAHAVTTIDRKRRVVQ